MKVIALKAIVCAALAGLISAQQYEPPFATAVGIWAACQKDPTGLPVSFCSEPPPPAGKEPDMLKVFLLNPSATGFVYFVDGTASNGDEKHYSATADRNDLNGATSVIFLGGIAVVSSVHIAEFSRSPNRRGPHSQPTFTFLGYY